MIDYKIIAVDFDGTLCENKWPDIGKPNTKLIEHLINEKNNGAKLILWTCRNGDDLTKAHEWCNEHGLYFDAINKNLSNSIETMGGDTRKVFADEYIDDRSSTKFKLPFKVDAYVTDKTCSECSCYDLCKTWIQMFDYEIEEDAIGAENCAFFKEK